MDGIAKQSESSIQNSGNAPAPSTAFHAKTITALHKIADEKSLATLSALVQGLEVGSDITNTIEREALYLAKIPKKLAGDFRSGALTFMQKSDTHESLGVIVGADHLNRGFVTIEQRYQPYTSLLHSLSNLAMQQQLARMADVLNEVCSRIVELQKTYDSSLYGRLRGVHDQLLRMQESTGPDRREKYATDAVISLNVTRGEITQRLIDELKKLPETPVSRSRAICKTLTTKGFRESLTEGYDRIQELFSYYLTATQLLAYTFAFLDEPASCANVFSPDPELFQGSYLKKLILAETCVGYAEDAWYKKPEEYLEKILRESRRMFDSDSETIEIEITGAQLLEAITNEQEKQ